VTFDNDNDDDDTTTTKNDSEEGQPMRSPTTTTTIKCKSLVIGGTKQITSYQQLEEVKQVMREALQDLGQNVPDYLWL
jgi:hypothetical protein